MYFRSSGLYGVYNNGTAIDSVTVAYTIGQVEIFQYEFDGTTLGARLTGGTAATVAATQTDAFDTVGLTLGRQNNLYFDGRMMEVLIYDSALSTTNRQNVEGYLAWKWGLVSKLPAGHPYKSAPPAGFRA